MGQGVERRTIQWDSKVESIREGMRTKLEAHDVRHLQL